MAPVENNLNMVQWIESLGWKYISNCGCSGNFSIYRNDTIPNWEIQINSIKTIFKIHFRIGIDSKKKGQAGPMNYKDAYNYWIIDNNISI